MQKHIILTIVMTLVLLTGLNAQALFSFSVDDLETSGRTGNWAYDFDNIGMVPLFRDDSNHFTESIIPGYQFHYYSERYVGNGATTAVTCTAENTDLASVPGELTLSFTQFNLVSFRRVNTVDPTAPWNTPGQAGDERVYANSIATISYNGTPVLTLSGATFVITTPYPNEAQIRAINPATMNWNGSIGTGLPQTAYGFGDLNLAESDPDWAALFAASNYKVDITLANISYITNPALDPDKGWYDFDLDIAPAAVSYNAGNAAPDLSMLPLTFDFPDANVELEVTAGTEGGATDEMDEIFVKEVLAEPSGALPLGANYTTKKYWKLGSTMESFTVDISFDVSGMDFAKGPSDWKVLYRPYNGDWALYGDYTLVDANTIKANNVSEVGEFTVASPLDETLPVELSSFAASINSANMAVITWTTASETDMNGFKIYASNDGNVYAAICLTPNQIAAQNTSTGSTYSYTADSITEAGTWYFWLESISLSGESEFYGPVIVTLTGEPQSPGFPERSSISAAYPNPFVLGQNSNLDVEIKASDSGSVNIYNLAGQLIKSYPVTAGIQTLTWDGFDSNGKACASGVYLYKLNTSGTQEIRKMMLMK